MGKLAEILAHPEEILPLVRMYRASKEVCKLPKDPDLAFCYGMLNDVSRSFAVVIQQLPNPLRDAVCVFYLVLRGLDTVEDDMALSDDIKLPALLSFHKDIYSRNFTVDCGYNHYKRLMANFGIVVNVFLGLDEPFQLVIADITRRMGEGMAKYIQQDVVTAAQYDEYCHYVAGLVGIGLSQLFASSGLESEDYAQSEELANHMGLFLQKTNIIRDYLEDIMEEPAPRMFWPKEIWGLYAKQLADFKDPNNRQAAVQCLNHMILDALQHLPHCAKYMQGLRNVNIFRFCAIPQIMAAGTLALCYNNGRVFEGVVKMRRGQTATVFDRCSNMGDLYSWFLQFLNVLEYKVHQVEPSDPTVKEARLAISAHKAMCSQNLKKWRAKQAAQGGITSEPSTAGLLLDYTALTAAAVYFYAAWGFGAGVPGLPPALFASQLLLHRLLSALFLLLTLRAAIMVSR